MSTEMDPRVERLTKIPQPAQRSPEWFAARKDRLTASDVDTVLLNNKYDDPVDVLFKKCGLGKPFTGNKFTEHGQKYEDEAVAKYCREHGKTALDFGLLPHPTVSWLGGSPDGITTDGIVIEVKCPWSRKIVPGECPLQYQAQVKMNMEVCGLDRAVFIEYVPQGHLGRDEEFNVVYSERDPEWFPRVLPQLESFWNNVLRYRREGIHTHRLHTYYANLNRAKVVHSLACELDDDEDENQTICEIED